MKQTKKIIAALAAATMVTSCAGVVASAAEAVNAVNVSYSTVAETFTAADGTVVPAGATAVTLSIENNTGFSASDITLSATADLATRRFDLFIVILLLFERFAAHRQLLSVLWCLLLVSESFTITSQVGGKADPQDKSNIYVETVSKFCRNCVNYTKLLYSSLFFLIFFSKM